jgi:hypothetical protein
VREDVSKFKSKRDGSWIVDCFGLTKSQMLKEIEGILSNVLNKVFSAQNSWQGGSGVWLRCVTSWLTAGWTAEECYEVSSPKESKKTIRWFYKF